MASRFPPLPLGVTSELLESSDHSGAARHVVARIQYLHCLVRSWLRQRLERALSAGSAVSGQWCGHSGKLD